LDRVRRPRVQITYDVETNGALQKVELPFVVGVMADLSGQPKDPLPILKERKFANIDRDNFNDVLAKAAPRLAFRVADKLSGQEGQQMGVELNFRNMDDFDPAKVAAQVPALKKLLDARHELTQLLAKMEGNDKLEAMLTEILANTENAAKLAGELGVEAPKEGGN
jgi:type VI secretion system protein ImpB